MTWFSQNNDCPLCKKDINQEIVKGHEYNVKNVLKYFQDFKKTGNINPIEIMNTSLDHTHVLHPKNDHPSHNLNI